LVVGVVDVVDVADVVGGNKHLHHLLLHAPYYTVALAVADVDFVDLIAEKFHLPYDVENLDASSTMVSDLVPDCYLMCLVAACVLGKILIARFPSLLKNSYPMKKLRLEKENLP
jgi:hypothetical protein